MTEEYTNHHNYDSIKTAIDEVAAGNVHPDVVRKQFGEENGFETLLKSAIAERERKRDEPVEDNIPVNSLFEIEQ